MKNAHPLISVIIPTFDRPEKLANCLKSIKKSNYKNLEIIVINDSPTKLSVNSVMQSNIKIIQHKKEVFWVNCRNEGAVLAKGSILFFVDDDNILGQNAINLLLKEYLSLNNVGLLGPVMYGRNGKLWFYGAKANWINPYPKKVSESQLSHELIETDVIPNAYMISKKLYIQIGMEDPDMLHHDEFDLAQRLKIKGYKNYIYSKATITHDFGSIKSRINSLRLYITIKCHIIIEKKYAPKWKFLLFLLIFIPINTVYYYFYKIPSSRRENKGSLYKAYLNGLKDGFKYKITKQIDS